MKLLPTLAALMSTATATSLQLSISPSTSLLDLSDLPPSTHATLHGSHGNRISVFLRQDNSFLFPLLEEGSYLLDIHTLNHAFPSLRVDVSSPSSSSSIPSQSGDQETPAPTQQEQDTISVYLTHPSNKWSNPGAKIASSKATLSSSEVLRVAVSAQGQKQYYEVRQGFDLLGFFKNPMILMGVLSMGLVFGMPYLMENMDEETKAEFAEMQKNGPMGAGGASGTAQQIQNFDLAGWMAGKSDASSSSSASRNK